MKRYCSILLITILIVGFIPLQSISAAPEDDIIMDAEVGFDGYFKLREWIPVKVYIENHGNYDIKGSIEVIGDQSNSTAMCFTTPAVIPKNTKKQIVLYVRVNIFQKNMKIDLKSEGKVLKTIEKKNFIPMSTDDFMLGILTDDKTGLNYWWEKQSEDRLFSNYEAIALESGDIPSEEEIMNNFTMFIIDDFDMDELSPSQTDAMSEWIRNGGILIVGTGADGIKTLKGLPSDMVSSEGGSIRKESKPVELENLAKTEIMTDVPFEFMDLSYDNTWTVVAGDNDSPYIIMRRYGNGYIFVSSFALGRQPMTGWTGSKALWETVLYMNLDPSTYMKFINPEKARDREFNISYNIFEALANIPEMDPPSASKLILILFIYLLVIGPISYIILKRRDRREFMWITIPVFVMIFSLGIYGIGNMGKGDKIVSNIISIAELWGEGNSKKVDTYTGVFIPSGGDYLFELEDESLLFPIVDYNAYYPDIGDEGRKNIVAEVIQGGEPAVRILDAKMWTMEPFYTTSTVDNIGKIGGNLAYRDGKLVGTVENNTSLPLEDVTIICHLGYYSVGNLAAGATKNVEIEVTDYDSRDLYPQSTILYDMLDKLYPLKGEHDIGRYRNVEERNMYVKRNLLEDIISGVLDDIYAEYRKSRRDISFETIVFGFNDQKLTYDIEVDGQAPQKSYYTNLMVDRLSVDTNIDGHISIPPGVMGAEIDGERSQDLDTYEIYDNPSSIYLYNSKRVSFYFDMTNFKDIYIDKCIIYIKAIQNGNISAENLYIKLYDVQSGSYVDENEGFTIDREKGIVTLQPSYIERFLDENNRLYINVGINAQSDYIDIEVFNPTLEIEGRHQ